MICKRCNIVESRTKKSHYCEDCYIITRAETYSRSHSNNKTKRNEVSRDYKKNNSRVISDYNKEYRLINKDILSEKRKEKRKINKDKLNKESVVWRANNKYKVLEYNRVNTPKYNKKYPWRKAIRTILYNSLKRIGGSKEGKTIELLGYSAELLKLHIESLFSDGMSWNNYGEWHIDHKIPVCFFEKETPMSIVNSLDNLQPLWALDNLSKGKKMSF